MRILYYMLGVNYLLRGSRVFWQIDSRWRIFLHCFCSC